MHEKLQDDEDLHWCFPPRNVHDADGWEVYWKNQILREEYLFFSDIFLNDLWLAKTMINRRGQTILCAGNGVSLEPHALACYAGFQVTAADLSVEATNFIKNLRPKSKYLRRFFCGGLGRPMRRPGETLAFYLEQTRLVLEYLSEHYQARRLRRRRGTIEFVAGNLLDADVCPGPFDAVIERRMVQLFPESERHEILSRLAGRLKPGGIFVSHCHFGTMKPRQAMEHSPATWFRENGFLISDGQLKDLDRGKHEPQSIAVISVSTG